MTLLFLLITRENTSVWSSRENDSFTIIQNVTYQQVEDANSPAGLVSEYIFTVDGELAHDTNLIFYASHKLVDIWVDDMHVYSLEPNEQISFIKTVGSKWVVLPIYREDAGKDVKVVLTPVYENNLDSDVTFYLGSSLAVYQNQLHQMLPSLALSLINVLVGILLLVIVIFCWYTKRDGREVLSLGMLAITMGLWQFTHNDFSPFMADKQQVFLYYVSVTMMLVCMIPLVQSAKGLFYGRGKRLFWYYVVGVAVMGIVQLLLQLFGVLDLREMFPFTHGSIILGALLLIGDTIWEHLRGRRKTTDYKNVRYAWILGAGALVDLVLYYASGTSSGLPYTLLAILCFVLLEGARFMAVYVE